MFRILFSGRSKAVSTIVAINLLVFILWQLLPSMDHGTYSLIMPDNFLISWDAIQDGRIWTTLTSVFSHNLFLHFFLNMYVLIGFGPILEMTLGTFRFVRFYLLAGIISSFGHAFVSAFILGEPSLPALGASGAISGIILLFSLLYPKQKILILGLIPVPALAGGAIMIGLDLWGLWAQAEGGGLPIGHGAHLGGAITGICYYLFVLRKPSHSHQSSG